MGFTPKYVQQTGGKGKGYCLSVFVRGGFRESV